MAFQDDIRSVPRAHDPDRGREAAASVPGATGAVSELIVGAAGSSPYLSDLLRREGRWLSEVMAQSPNETVPNVLATLEDATSETIDATLRTAKRRIALFTALADLGGVWTLEDVTRALTHLADCATQTALRVAVTSEVRRGKLPGQTEDDVAEGGGLAVIAMGKMGAFELNYSSDIDLICLYDETRFDPSDYAAARASFVRIVRRMTKHLSERTADGYVFRTDLRLRPDASVTPIAISMEAAERYYESFGRTWERAAYIKARTAAGDIRAGAKFLETLRPFVWRRHLDFAAIQDAHDMRLRIRDHKGLTHPISHLGHDVKLGQGGIREIEFFTQTRQIIAGGRDPDLRVRGTVDGLRLLAEKDWVPTDDAQALTREYRALRTLEHRIQMIADQQTHCLPTTEADFDRLAALSGVDPKDYAQDIRARFARVSDTTETFFAPAKTGVSDSDRPADRELSETALEVISKWENYPALRSKRAGEIFQRMKPGLLSRLATSRNAEEAIVHFDGFLKGLPAGVQLFSLFEANPQLRDLVVDIVDTAPALGHYLSRNAKVFDAVIGGGFFADWPGVTALTHQGAEALEDEDDYEARLDRARLWQREWQFRVGVHHLRGLISARDAGRQYADLAQATVAALWPHVVAQFEAKHGPMPGRGAVVLGMGSLGAGRLNAGSDLDLIMIYDGQGVEASEGRRPLATRAYYARLTQAMVTALSAPTAEGRLYEVDMRLRPSGRQGPVATGLAAFRAYQVKDAWTWEHLALTRARPVAGSTTLAREVDDFREELLSAPRDKSAILRDVAAMRAKLAEAKPATGRLDAKAGPGRLTDIELFAETAALLSGSPARSIRDQLPLVEDVFDLGPDAATELREAYEVLWQVQCAVKLLGSPADPDALGAGAVAFLTRNLAVEGMTDLMALVEETTTAVAMKIDDCIGRT